MRLVFASLSSLPPLLVFLTGIHLSILDEAASGKRF